MRKDTEKVNSCYDQLFRLSYVFLKVIMCIRAQTRSLCLSMKRTEHRIWTHSIHRFRLGFTGCQTEKKPAAWRTKVYKYGLCTFRISCFHQQRICIFKQTAGLLQPPNPHALLLLKGWQDRLVPQYCQGFFGVNGAIFILFLPLDLHCCLLFILRQLGTLLPVILLYLKWFRHFHALPFSLYNALFLTLGQVGIHTLN